MQTSKRLFLKSMAAASAALFVSLLSMAQAPVPLTETTPPTLSPNIANAPKPAEVEEVMAASASVSTRIDLQRVPIPLTETTPPTLSPNIANAPKPAEVEEVMAASASESTRIDLQREEVFIHPDQTYEITLTTEQTILTQKGILEHLSMSSPSYFHGPNRVELVEAYTLQPDGTKIPVPKENVFVVTSPSDPAAPGFVTSLEQHASFPQVKIGSKMHVQWRYVQSTIPIFPFSDTISPSFARDTLRTEMIVNVPSSMYVKWAKEGSFQVQESMPAGRHVIRAVLGPHPAMETEPFMPANTDLLPFFEVTTFKSWEEIGNIFSKLTTPKQVVTPEIKILVQTIVGDLKGKEAVQAIYNWTATHIAYLEVVISSRQGYVPPFASEIIENRFGDCKGHCCVLQTMLKVLSIESYLVLVNWNNSLKQYPLPIPAFDHEMVFVPAFDMFLNPTDQYSLFNAPLAETNFSNKQPQVLANKPALIAKPTSSVLVTTPPGIAEQNQYRITNRIQIDLQGDMQIQGDLEASGCFAEVIRELIFQLGSFDKLFHASASNKGVKSQVVAKGTDPQDLNVPMRVEYSWEGQQVAQRSKGELFFQIPITSVFFTSHFFSQFISPSNSRKYPLIIGASIYQWSHVIDVPPGYKVGKQPLDVQMMNPAGSYVATYKMVNGSLEVLRRLELQKNVYTPDEYSDVALLLQQMLQDHNAICSLAQKNTPKTPSTSEE